MRRPWKVPVSLAAVGCVVFVGLALAQTAPPASPVVHTLTPERNGQVIRVHPGDELIVRLPTQMPFRWSMLNETAELTRLKTPLKLLPIQPGREGPPAPEVGGPQMGEMRYRVNAPPKHRVVQWVYHSPIPAPNNTPPQPSEPIKPGRSPSKGSFFRVTLEPRA